MKQRKPKMSVKALEERLANLYKLMGEEAGSEKPSELYIFDLKDSIDSVKREISFYKKNPSPGYQMVD